MSEINKVASKAVVVKLTAKKKVCGEVITQTSHSLAATCTCREVLG
jgi:hypothetical protein